MSAAMQYCQKREHGSKSIFIFPFHVLVFAAITFSFPPPYKSLSLIESENSSLLQHGNHKVWGNMSV
jgi:hypothetical protein